jgi:actin-related protein
VKSKPVGIAVDPKPSSLAAAATTSAPALTTRRSEDTPVVKKSSAPSSRIGKGTAIVLDGGSYIIRAGFAGEDKPACIMRSSMTTMRQEGDGFKATGELVFGSICDSPDLDADLPNNLIKDGVVTDWNAMEQMWHHIFSTQQLHIDPKEYPVLLTERQLGPILNRERATQVMFETFEIPAFCLYYATTLQMFGSGRTNGMILDCGEYACTAVPFYEGHCFPFAANRTLVGGLDIDKRLHTLQEKYLHTDDRIMRRELQLTKSLKEVFANVSPTADITPDNGLLREYQLPDGHKIYESPVKGQQCAEVLFNPDLVGKEALGIHDLLLKSLMVCDVHYRQYMAANIVIAGGTSCLPGLQARLTRELTEIFPTKYKVKVIPGGANLAWEGGSILASLSHFPSLCITKAEYDEVGPSIIRRRLF